jgi:hypothetical protein
MSIAVGNLPLPHRHRFKNLTPRRYRAAVLWKAKPTAPLPHRIQMEFTAAAPPPRRH